MIIIVVVVVVIYYYITELGVTNVLVSVHEQGQTGDGI